MSWIEITGFVFGIAGVWLTVKGHWACFPVGLVNVTASFFLFHEQRLYSDTVQQAVYFVLLSYGWYQWRFRKPGERPVIGYTTARMKAGLALAILLVSGIMGYVFRTWSDADLPYLDATATALSFTAQYLVAGKKIENWLLWIVVNLMYIGIYLYKDLYLYAVLFLVYLLLAIRGYYTWKAEMQSQLSTGIP